MDIALNWNEELNGFDIDIANGDLVADDGLKTAVIVSLFTDKYLDNTDEARGNSTERAGWWGDETLPGNDTIGSKLWLLKRAVITSDVETKAAEYAKDALSWMIADRLADDVQVSVVRVGTTQLNFTVEIVKPNKIIHKYKMLWNTMAAR